MMYLDALVSMVAYTIVTVAFYLLGAAVLHAQDLTPEGHATITTLANMYTDSLGTSEASTILGGVILLIDLGSVPVALVIFIFSVMVPDVAATCDRVAELGGRVLIGPETVEGAGLVFANLEDPDGNHFGVFTPPAA